MGQHSGSPFSSSAQDAIHEFGAKKTQIRILETYGKEAETG